MEDPGEVVDGYGELLDDLGWKKAQRQLGIRINVDRPPTSAELHSMIEQSQLSLVWIDLSDNQRDRVR